MNEQANAPMHLLKIPATSANLGAGFDTAGLALELYNELFFCPAEALQIELAEPNPRIPLDSSNMIYAAAKRTADLAGRALPPFYMKQYNHIPMASGMGSSAACIVGGILIADTLLNLWLSKKQMLDIATQIEGHPDNVAPAIYGGLCINQNNEGNITTLQIPVEGDIAVCVAYPSFALSTKQSRQMLPTKVTMADAVHNLSCMSFLTAAFYTQNYALLPQALDDRLHQPYRKHLIPGYDEVASAAQTLGAYGTCLSGAGPSMLCFVKASELSSFAEAFSREIHKIPGDWIAIPSLINKHGATLEEAVQ